MDRAEAFKTLRLDQSADGRMVEHAYWTLVRQVQTRGAADLDAAHEIDLLNEAYTVLSPEGKPGPAMHHGSAAYVQVPAGTGIAVLDWFADWMADEALRTRGRWHGRNPEIAVIGGGALFLFVLAVGAGASLMAAFLGAGIVIAAIWAPWRRIRAQEPEPQPPVSKSRSSAQRSTGRSR
jgi:hypothetical protein